MIDRVLDLVKSEDRANIELVIGFYKAGLFKIEDLIFESMKSIRNTNSKKVKILGKLCLKIFNNNVYLALDSIAFDGYCHLKIEDKIEHKHLEFAQQYFNTILFPQLFLNHQKTCELVLKIRRTNSSCIRFPIETKVMNRIQKALIKSDYRSLLFCFGVDFLKNLYKHYQSVKWFDECSKIEADVKAANIYFKLKNPILL